MSERLNVDEDMNKQTNKQKLNKLIQINEHIDYDDDDDEWLN